MFAAKIAWRAGFAAANNSHLKPQDMTRKPAGRIRGAIESDIPVIHGWLSAQPNDVESLYVNWATTLKVYKQRGMLVYEDNETGQPVAYFWGSLTSEDSVLDVRADFRGHGIGRALVSHLVEVAVRDGEGLLKIACAPASSMYFWQRMGFQVAMTRPNPTARRALLIPRPLPSDSKPVAVSIRFAADVLDEQAPQPKVYTPEARIDPDGNIWLDRKISHFVTDRFLEVVLMVDGTDVYSGPLNTTEVQRLGFTACTNGYAIERITC